MTSLSSRPMPSRERLERFVVFLLFAVPLLSLALSALAWLKYSIDLPHFDDWREFIRFAHPGSLDPSRLFASSNGTVYTTGLLLDALAIRLLAGNAVVYPLISMLAVLGSLLWLQWRLLKLVLTEPAARALCFGLTVFMLQPESYWGTAYIAYHQALPLVGVLAILLIVLGRDRLGTGALAGVAAIALAAGLSYVSGAFAVVLLCAVFGVIGLRVGGTAGGRLRRAALALALPAALTLAIQLNGSFDYETNAANSAGFELALPTSPDYWFFLLGKIARALMLSRSAALVSLIVTLAVLALALYLAALFVGRVARRTTPVDEESLRFTIIFVSLGAIIFAYLGLVAAARALLDNGGVTGLGIFQFGFARFHFFWVTLLWPWVLAGVLLAVQRGMLPPKWDGGARWSGLFLVAFAVAAGALAHDGFYRKMLNLRMTREVPCLRAALAQGGPILCEAAYPFEMTRAYPAAWNLGISFTRYFVPAKAPAPGLPLLWSLTENDPSLGEAGDGVLWREGGLDVKAPRGVALSVALPASPPLERCLMIEVIARVTSASPGSVQLAAQVPNGEGGVEWEEARRALTPGRTDAISLLVASREGFGTALRITASPSMSRIEGLEAYCVLRQAQPVLSQPVAPPTAARKAS